MSEKNIEVLEKCPLKVLSHVDLKSKSYLLFETFGPVFLFKKVFRKKKKLFHCKSIRP